MRKYLYLIKKQKIKSWLKFWLLTNKQFNSILSEILEGISFNLQNTVKRYFKIFQIFGNSVQDGTPSPSSPVPINSVADDINLLNRITCEENMSLVWTSGSTFNETNSLVSDYIRINPNEKLVFTYKAQMFFYDENKTYLGCLQEDETSIAKTTGTEKYSLTIPNINTIYYIKLGFRTSTNNNQNMITANIKVQKGTVTTPYSPYNQGTLTIKQTVKNLFNKNAVINNYELLSTGDLHSKTGWWTSDFIHIKENTSYYLSGQKTSGSTNAFYDKNKNFLSRQNAITDALITSPPNAKYLRINGLLTELDNNIQVEERNNTIYISSISRI